MFGNDPHTGQNRKTRPRYVNPQSQRQRPRSEISSPRVRQGSESRKALASTLACWTVLSAHRRRRFSSRPGGAAAQPSYVPVDLL